MKPRFLEPTELTMIRGGAAPNLGVPQPPAPAAPAASTAPVVLSAADIAALEKQFGLRPSGGAVHVFWFGL